MDKKDRAGYSVAQTRAHLALVAEELARRASLDYVKDQAKHAAQNKAHEVVMNVRYRPQLIAGAAAAVGAIAALVVIKKRRARQAQLPVYRRVKPVSLAKATAKNVVHAFRDATAKKHWLDSVGPPLLASVAIFTAIFVSVARRKMFPEIELIED